MALRRSDDPPRDVEWIALGKLRRDERVNTRPVDQAWVDKRTGMCDPDGIGILHVSARPPRSVAQTNGELHPIPDDSFIVLDGQNRAQLVRQALGPDQAVQCKVYRGLTLAEEARLFRILNDDRAVGVVYRFIARLTEGEKVATNINETIEHHGWRIAASPAEGKIAAVASLEAIYHGDRAKTIGGCLDNLDHTLAVVTGAWGHRAGAANGEILKGIGLLLARHGDVIDMPALIKKLAARGGGPDVVLGDARGMKEYHGGSVAHNVADIVTGIYNKGRRSGQLPDWRRS